MPNVLNMAFEDLPICQHIPVQDKALAVPKQLDGVPIATG
jgi:hypothetical protein